MPASVRYITSNAIKHHLYYKMQTKRWGNSVSREWKFKAEYRKNRIRGSRLTISEISCKNGSCIKLQDPKKREIYWSVDSVGFSFPFSSGEIILDFRSVKLFLWDWVEQLTWNMFDMAIMVFEITIFYPRNILFRKMKNHLIISRGNSIRFVLKC